MRGITFTGNRTLGVMNFPDPTRGPRDVILEITASDPIQAEQRPRTPDKGDRGAIPVRSAFDRPPRWANDPLPSNSRHPRRQVRLSFDDPADVGYWDFASIVQ